MKPTYTVVGKVTCATCQREVDEIMPSDKATAQISVHLSNTKKGFCK